MVRVQTTVCLCRAKAGALRRLKMERRKQMQKKGARLVRHTAELAEATPQVVAMRMGRLWQAGMCPNVADGQEIYRMSAEKLEAFQESWLGMTAQALSTQQQMAWWSAMMGWRTVMGGWMNPLWLPTLSAKAQDRVMDSALDVALRGVDPVYRRAKANARRLSRRRH